MGNIHTYDKELNIANRAASGCCVPSAGPQADRGGASRKRPSSSNASLNDTNAVKKIRIPSGRHPITITMLVISRNL